MEVAAARFGDALSASSKQAMDCTEWRIFRQQYRVRLSYGCAPDVPCMCPITNMCPMCCVVDGCHSRPDMWHHFLAPGNRCVGWSLDYVCERKHFGRVIEIEAIRAHKHGKPFKMLDLLRPMADPDVGIVQLATINNSRGPPCEEEKALYIAVVRDQVFSELKFALAKREKHALAQKRRREAKGVQLLAMAKQAGQ
eukprot:COSAG01_NODE_11219_length_1979_cov_6.107315_1_plen_196_part_00